MLFLVVRTTCSVLFDFGLLSAGCYDAENEEYQTICKIGTGFSEAALDAHTTSLGKHAISKPKPYYK